MNTVNSKENIINTLKIMIMLTVSILGMIQLVDSFDSFNSVNIYKKDFIQEYMLAKAVLSGTNPYLQLSTLGELIFGQLPVTIFQHPTPHPPPVAVLMLPLGILTYNMAAIVWFIFELFCIVIIACYILLIINKRLTVIEVLVASLAILAWNPVIVEIVLGQLMLFILALLVCAWQKLHNKQELSGGLLLGLAISFKLIVWPILVYLTLCKRWKAVIAAFTTVVLANFMAIFIMGWSSVITYYLETGPKVASLYHSFVSNFSLWSLSWKALEGTGSKVLVGVTAPPLIQSSEFAGYLACVLPLIVLVFGMTSARRSADFDISFGILLCVSILIAPIAWNHYLILTLIPMVIIGKYYIKRKLASEYNILYMFIVAALLVPQSTINAIIDILMSIKEVSVTNSKIAFLIAQIGMFPALVVVGILLLLHKVGNTSIVSSCNGKMT